MEIAICDDDDFYCSILEDWVEEYALDNVLDFNISIYNTADRMFRDMSDNTWFDVIFLDIELPGVNGVATGKKIRDKLRNDQTSIVYISGKTSYCLDLFDTQPLNFHVKPVKKEDIFKDLEKAIERSSVLKKRFSFKYEGVTKGINIGDIMYFQPKNKLVKVATCREEYLFRGNLNEIEGTLPDNVFCRCHKSFVVNLNYVVIFRYNEMVLRNGLTIPIGRNYRENVKEKQMKLEMGE